MINFLRHNTRKVQNCGVVFFVVAFACVAVLSGCQNELFQDAEKNFKKLFLGKKLTVRYLTLNKYGCPTQITAIGIRKDL